MLYEMTIFYENIVRVSKAVLDSKASRNLFHTFFVIWRHNCVILQKTFKVTDM